MTPIVVSATATLAGAANICILTLDGKKSSTFLMVNGSKVSASSCAIYANSTSPTAMKIEPDSTVKAGLVCSAGGAIFSPGKVVPTPTFDCPQIADPLADRKVTKPVGACKAANFKNGTHTLDPGNYCSGISIVSSAKASFKPGDYYISGGEFRVAGNAEVSGSNVAFYLDGSAATLNLTGNSVIDFNGRETGPMAGMLFFEDPNVPFDREHRINSAVAKNMTGTIYMPRGKLLIDPKATVAANSAYTAIVVHTLELRDGPELVMNSDYNLTPVPVPAGLIPSGDAVLVK
jgi:hypothetical protein